MVRPHANSTNKRSVSLQRWRRLRLLPLAVAAVAMAAGLWTGLARLGVALHAGDLAWLVEFHAAFMISGFLGTVISLERAVALGRWWAYAAPALSSVGALALLAGMPVVAALAFLCAGALLLAGSASIALRQPALFTVVLAIGTACWLAGTFLWVTGYSMPVVVGWWLNFLILTIAAERLELSRMTKPSPSSRITFSVVVLLLICGSARGELALGFAPFTAAGLVGTAAWLLRYDLARRTILLTGQPRFIALSILAGHVWLTVAGVLLFLWPPGVAAFSFDAAVHAITIGFVLSMIFGHAPIILPALLGIRVQYNNISYVPLTILHASLVLRIAGDLSEHVGLRAESGMATVVALAGYAAYLIFMSAKPAARAI